MPGLQGQLNKGVAGAWQIAPGRDLVQFTQPFTQAVPLLVTKEVRTAASPPPRSRESAHSGQWQPPLTVGVHGQQIRGTEQLHIELLLRGVVGSLDRDST